MLTWITAIPDSVSVSGAHCVPVMENGDLVLVWDRAEQVLTTIGGRLEPNESIEEALDREAIEEAGIELADEKIPFAAWHWKEFDSYRIYFLAKVKRFTERPDGFETTGYVVVNFETAIDMIGKIEGRPERIEVIRRAGILTGQLAPGPDDN